MRIYNKLVRDNIPEIVEQNGEIANIRILNDYEYSLRLREKLLEEVNEFLSNEKDSVEELADIYEVILAILKKNGVSFKDFETVQKQKLLKNGAFDKRIFLLSVGLADKEG